MDTCDLVLGKKKELGTEHLSIREEGCSLNTYVEWKRTRAYLDLEQEGWGLDSWA